MQRIFDRWVERDVIGRLYAAIFAGVAIYSLGVLAASLLRLRYRRWDSLQYAERVFEVAEITALLSLCGSALVGIALCLGCFWLNREPTNRLANCTLAAIVLTVLLFLLLPAIQVA